MGELQNERREFVQSALDRSGSYTEVMAPILEEEGVPAELAYVPLIESGFDTGAVSPKRAVGPWQFIGATGRRYGLRIDRYVDERRDPEKSTRAAARYLSDLYDMFGTWPLALAAYNTGENRVGNIIERRGAMSFWEMMGRGYLYPETRQYVPFVLAAARIGMAPTEYGFDAPVTAPRSYEVVGVDRSISLRELAQMSDASVAEIKALNPALIGGVTPPGPGVYELRVPEGSGQGFEIAYARWRRTPHKANLPVSRQVGSIEYRVRRGDTPSTIAKRFGVSVQALMRANKWRNARRLVPGRPVRVPVPNTREPATRAAVESGRLRVAAHDKSRTRGPH